MNNKKKAAAMAAVLQYIKDEEVVASMQSSYAAEQAKSTSRSTLTSQWSSNGRQTQMHMRNLLQMKSFHGSKLR
jgi:hypothetical protein